MKILCLTDFQITPGQRWLWDNVPGNQDQVEFLYSPTNDRHAKWGKLFAYYPAYFKLAWQAIRRTRQENYDFIVACRLKKKRERARVTIYIYIYIYIYDFGR